MMHRSFSLPASAARVQPDLTQRGPFPSVLDSPTQRYETACHQDLTQAPAEAGEGWVLQAEAATVIQRHVRGLLCRRNAWRQAQRLQALLIHKPGIAGLRAPRPAVKRALPGAPGEDVSAPEMNHVQRLRHLKELFPDLWEKAVESVDAQHPQVLAHLCGQTLGARQRHKVVVQKREDAFVAALPDDAFCTAGFFSPTKRRISLRGRTFTAPVGDLDMTDAVPVRKKSRAT